MDLVAGSGLEYTEFQIKSRGAAGENQTPKPRAGSEGQQTW